MKAYWFRLEEDTTALADDNNKMATHHEAEWAK